MEEEENFDVDWLNERYPFDAEARDRLLENEVIDFLSNGEALNIVDVGAGTGSNCLYFIDKFPQNQKWYLVEQNEALKKATIRRFRDYANFHKYDFERKKNKLSIRSLQKKVQVHIINGSLLDLAELVNLKKIDLVVANAVFDLFTAAQIKGFSDTLIEYKLPFYTTLNYQAMEFLPDDPFDDIFIAAYNAHMERQQSFGKALGKNAAAYLESCLNTKDGAVQTAVSTWQIGYDDIKMHYYLLNFMENALAEMDLDAGMQQNLEKWVQRKKDYIITRQQRLEIRHLDVFYRGTEV